MMSMATALWITWATGTATTATILVFVVISALGAGITTAAWQSFVPQLIPRSDLLSAVRVNSMQFTAARAFGPALAGLVLAVAADRDEWNLYTQPACRRLHVAQLNIPSRTGVGRVIKDRNGRGMWNQVVEQAEPFGRQIKGKNCDARQIAARPIETTYQAVVNGISSAHEHNGDG